MSHETIATNEQSDEPQVAWNAFQLWTGSRDADHFRSAYLGRFPDRDAVGRQLLEDFGVHRRLQRLPEWLQRYIRLDGAAFLADFEAEGNYYVYDAPDGAGCYIFDAYSQPARGTA